MMKHLYSLLLFLTFTLGLNAQFSEDFESGFPADWSKDDAWMHGTAAALSSEYFTIGEHTLIMAVNDDVLGPGVATDARMSTPKIDLTGIDYPFVRFAYFFYDGDYGADEQANVLVSDDDGATWTQLSSLPGANWATTYVSLLDYAGKEIQLAFDYTDGGGWNYGLAIDDIEVVNYAVFSEVELFSVTGDCSHAVSSAEYSLRGGLTNYAIYNVTSFDVEIETGGEVETVTVSDVDIEPFRTLYFDIPMSFEMSDADVMHNLTIKNLNTGEDEDMSNNSMDLMVEVVNAQPKSAALIEEGTGTWCTWCPRGAVYMDRATKCFGDHFVGIAVHDNDPMENSAYNSALTGGNDWPGWPNAIINRNGNIDPQDIFDPIADQIVLPPMAEIEADVIMNPETRELTVEASASFRSAIPEGYRWNAVLTEDGVTGTSTGYDQINAYSGGNFGPMGGYENLPNPVPASQMVYDHVARTLLAGFNGAAGSIPALDADVETEFTFNPYTVPAGFNWEKLHVAVFIHNASGRVVAAQSFDVDTTATTPVFYVENQQVSWLVAPNPVVDEANVTVTLPESGEIQITMVDMLGKIVSQQRHVQPQGTMNYTIERGSLPSGIYSVVLTYKKQNSVRKVFID